MIPRSDKRTVLLACIIIAGITILAHCRLLGCGFIDVYDDSEYVLKNPYVRQGLTARGLVWAFTKSYAANWHPITWISHMLDVQLYGLNPVGHHLSSIILHVANTVMLFLVLNRMTGYPWRSAFVALLFGVHPLHVESVAWVSERKDTLSTFFWMMVMLAYASGARRLVIPIYALGLMSKPMLVTLPIVLLIMDWWPLERTKKEGFKRLLIEKAPLFVLAAASGAITFLVQQRMGAMTSFGHFPLGIRAGNAAVSYFRYIGKMFWSRDLAVFYPHPGNELQAWQITLACLMLIIVSAAAIKAVRRPYILFGWLWYLVTLLPVIGIVQVGGQAMADRYTYVPLIGLFIAITWTVSRAFAKARLCTSNRAWNCLFLWERAGIKSISACAVISLLAACTWIQSGYWKDSIALFEHTTAVTAPNSIALTALGAAYAKRGRTDEAIRRYRQAISIDPGYAEAHNNLGLVLAEEGQLDEAIKHYRTALRLDPAYARVQSNLGAALARQGKLREAIGHFQDALRLDPYLTEAYSNLGSAYALLGRLDEAIRAFRQALEIDPNRGQVRMNLAVALFYKKDYADSWREARLAQRSGGVPPPGFLEELSNRMHGSGDRP